MADTSTVDLSPEGPAIGRMATRKNKPKVSKGHIVGGINQITGKPDRRSPAGRALIDQMTLQQQGRSAEESKEIADAMAWMRGKSPLLQNRDPETQRRVRLALLGMKEQGDISEAINTEAGETAALETRAVKSGLVTALEAQRLIESASTADVNTPEGRQLLETLEQYGIAPKEAIALLAARRAADAAEKVAERTMTAAEATAAQLGPTGGIRGALDDINTNVDSVNTSIGDVYTRVGDVVTGVGNVVGAVNRLAVAPAVATRVVPLAPTATPAAAAAAAAAVMPAAAVAAAAAATATPVTTKRRTATANLKMDRYKQVLEAATPGDPLTNRLDLQLPELYKLLGNGATQPSAASIRAAATKLIKDGKTQQLIEAVQAFDDVTKPAENNQFSAIVAKALGIAAIPPRAPPAGTPFPQRMAAATPATPAAPAQSLMARLAAAAGSAVGLGGTPVNVPTGGGGPPGTGAIPFTGLGLGGGRSTGKRVTAEHKRYLNAALDAAEEHGDPMVGAGLLEQARGIIPDHAIDEAYGILEEMV